jgi:hypothetical protein
MAGEEMDFCNEDEEDEEAVTPNIMSLGERAEEVVRYNSNDPWNRVVKKKKVLSCEFDVVLRPGKIVCFSEPDACVPDSMPFERDVEIRALDSNGNCVTYLNRNVQLEKDSVLYRYPGTSRVLLLHFTKGVAKLPKDKY